MLHIFLYIHICRNELSEQLSEKSRKRVEWRCAIEEALESMLPAKFLRCRMSRLEVTAI